MEWGGWGVVCPPEVSLKTQPLAASNQPGGTQGRKGIDADFRTESSHRRLFVPLTPAPESAPHPVTVGMLWG